MVLRCIKCNKPMGPGTGRGIHTYGRNYKVCGFCSSNMLFKAVKKRRRGKSLYRSY